MSILRGQNVELTSDQVFSPEERYNWRKYHYMGPTHNWLAARMTNQALYKQHIEYHRALYPNCATLEMWKYRPKLCFTWKIYSYFAAFIIGYTLHAFHYKIRVEEVYKVNSMGADYPHLIQSHLYYLFFKAKVYYLAYIKFWTNTYSYALNFTDHLNENPSNPAFFHIMKYKKFVRNDRYLSVRDDSFDFMDIGEDIIELVDDGV